MMMRRPKKREVEMNLSSFSDIAFLLIIFFILTTTFIKTQGPQMDIPSGEPAEQDEVDKTPTILLTRSEIMYNDDPISIEGLEEKLKEMKLAEKEDSERIIILESKEDVPYQRYYTIVTMLTRHDAVMALLTEAGDD